MRFNPVLLTLVLSVACAQAGGVEETVEYRQGLREVFRHNVSSMGDLVKGKIEFDEAVFSRNAIDLAAAAQLDVLAGFPEDSLSDESDTSDTIGLDWEKFQEKFKGLREQSAKLAEAAAGGDEAAMKDQFGTTAKTCKGCHDDFNDWSYGNSAGIAETSLVVERP